MTIHTFEVSCTVPKEKYFLIQDKLKNTDPTKWAKEKFGMSYWGLSKEGIIIKMFITKNKKKGYFAYNITYRISARRVMDNHDFVGLFNTKNYKNLEKEVNILLYCKCELLPFLKECTMRRIDFCFNAEVKNQEQVKAYVKTMKRANIPNHLKLLEAYDKKDVYHIIWMLSNIGTSYITATTEAVKLFDKGYIPTPLELYEDWCEL